MKRLNSSVLGILREDYYRDLYWLKCLLTLGQVSHCHHIATFIKVFRLLEAQLFNLAFAFFRAHDFFYSFYHWTYQRILHFSFFLCSGLLIFPYFGLSYCGNRYIKTIMLLILSCSLRLDSAVTAIGSGISISGMSFGSFFLDFPLASFGSISSLCSLAGFGYGSP